MKKKVLFSAVALLAASATFAQGNGMAGITEATNMVTSYFDRQPYFRCHAPAQAAEFFICPVLHMGNYLIHRRENFPYHGLPLYGVQILVFRYLETFHHKAVRVIITSYGVQ